MDNIWGSPIDYAPEYWPTWLIIATIFVALTVGVLVLHALLRLMLRPKPQEKAIEHKTFLYPMLIRIWHWSNALLFVLLLASGILNHFSLGPVSLLVKLHEIAGFALIVVWLLFVIVNITTGNIKHYKVNFNGWFKRVIKQVRFYLYGIMKGESHPFPATEESKFNPIQQVAYIKIMYVLLPLLILSGLACLYPISENFNYWIFIIHQVLAIISLLFLVVHIYLCTTGDTPGQTFKSMVDGYHRHNEHKQSDDKK